jgi:outer membrane lipase/esterase
MRLGTLFLAAAVSAATCISAHASQFSEIVAFGDSLSDPGNASIGSSGLYPGPGYATRTVAGVPFPVGYYTNPQYAGGPTGLWVDQLAAQLGVADPAPFLAGGTNYAVASAFTAGYNGAAPGMDAQIALFLAASGGNAPSSALYTLWGGANDIFDGLNPVTAADNIATEIKTLAAAGAQDFLWPDLPALGDTPELSGNPLLSTEANLASLAFDNEWALDLSQLDASGLDVIGVNVGGLFNTVTQDPTAFGLTNVSSACDTTVGCDPNTFLYWDTEHPTTEADSLIAGLANADIQATPEPPSISLLGLGAVGLFAFVRSRRTPVSTAQVSK